MKQLILIITIIALSSFSCRKEDVKTVVVKVPKLKNAVSAQIIQDAFMKQPGIKSIHADFERHELTITYNSMIIALKNIEFVIAGVGFDANDTPAVPESVKKLPPECR